MSINRFINDEVTRESKDYYEKKRIREVVESILTGLTYNQPEDPLAYMEECITKIKQDELFGPNSSLKWDTFLPTVQRPAYPQHRGIMVRKKNNQLQPAGLPSVPLYVNSGPTLQGKAFATLPPIAAVSVEPHTSLPAQGKPTSPRGPAWDNIVFVLGGPGCGKGTQCARLAKEFNYIHLSAGDLLREEVATGSELGKSLDAMLKEGKLVPMAVTIKIIKQAMERCPESNGFLIDGFPRQLDQAVAFEEQVAQCNFVLYFECSEAVLEARLLERGKTSGRSDDNLESIKKRFKTFKEASFPVIEEYLKKGKCIKINSERPVQIVYNETKVNFKPKVRGAAWNNIVFVLGGPGCGKGTQCARLAKQFNYIHLSSGDLLRAEVATGSKLGSDINALIAEGKMVPMSITIRLIKEAMEKARDANGFLIDGFPREAEQATAFETNVAECKFVLYFECSEAVLEARLLERGKTSGRSDDNLASIKKRFKTFRDTSFPVIETYMKKNKCIKINSERAVDQVYADASSHFGTKPESAKTRGPAWSNIVFVLGGPGCGKGTQCVRLAKQFNYIHLSSGDLLRAEVATGSKLGSDINALIAEGKMVPMSITIRLIKEAMEKAGEANGFLIDGFPREPEQATAFESDVSHFQVLEARLIERGKTSGRSDDNVASIKKRFKTFRDTSFPVIESYMNQGKCIKINSERAVEQVYADAQSHF